MTSFTESFVRQGIDAAIQGAALLAAVALALHLLRGRMSAAQRHLAQSPVGRRRAPHIGSDARNGGE